MVAAAALVGCCNQPQTTASGLNPADFVTTIDGQQTALYTLTNANGMEVAITPFGGRIVSIVVPDREGKMQDVVLGFDKIADYQNIPSDFGASIGRYANRIAQGKFTLDGVEYDLPKNNFGHCLHGGPNGWQYKLYTVAEATDKQLVLTLASPAGDENFPGNLNAKVIFTLTDENAIAIDYEAETDAPTIVNMTNHSYFNLSGDATKQITDHELQLMASAFTPVDTTYMTTGEILPVAGTPMDFTAPKVVGEEIDNFDYEQLKNGNGYDHNWVLDTAGDKTKPAAILYAPSTGIELTVYTTEPGIQLYTGNFLDGTATGKKGIVYNQRVGICLETQKYPDTPNKPEWPSAVLRPGEKYTSHCTFAFAVRE
ncbi:MAG: aldose epimerase family protein [Rikenellaceae bacterium]|nr:aldose epimerase family protein [Rikenellaceae bacterium]